MGALRSFIKRKQDKMIYPNQHKKDKVRTDAYLTFPVTTLKQASVRKKFKCYHLHANYEAFISPLFVLTVP